MAHIYRGAVVTICGPAAQDSTVGFIHPRTCPDPAPLLWEYKCPSSFKVVRATLTPCLQENPHHRSRDYPDSDSLTKKEESSPLRQRGWVLQEYLLSPRQIFFGPYRMCWECRYAKFEDFPGRGSWMHQGIQCTVSKETNHWFATVREYSKRHLTRAGDKLPAISGIAEWFDGRPHKDPTIVHGAGRYNQPQGDQYLAGLPQKKIIYGLMWHAEPAEDTNPAPVTAYRAPSWSWASTDYPVDFILRHRHGNRFVLYSDDCEKLKPTRPLTLKYQVEIREASVDLRGSNKFGEITGGSIKLTGSTKVGTVLWGSNYEWDPAFVVSNTNTDFEERDGWSVLQNPTSASQKGQWVNEVDSTSSGLTSSGSIFLVSRPGFVLQDSKSKKVVPHFYPDNREHWGLELSSEKLKTTRPAQGVKCLCIDFCATNNGSVHFWVGLVVEPIQPYRKPPDTTDNNLCHAYRRIGLVLSNYSMQSQLEFWGDSRREDMELF